jgi:CBS domain-containing protein
VGCLPVVEDGALVGIVTATDFLDASAKLFEERLTPKVAARETARGAHQSC